MIIDNKHISIVDCTLRDGGYYTNWDFPDLLVERYLRAMNVLPIDYIELGYRSLDTSAYYGEYNYLPKCVLEKCHKWCPDKKKAVMVNLKEVDEERVLPLLNHLSEYVHLIRLATRPDDIEKAVRVARVIKKYGLEVAVNVMYMSTWVENPAFAKSLEQADDIVDYLIMVDSYGSVYPYQIENCITGIKRYYKGKIGFHGHNNMELAFANTLAAITGGVDLADATITGMGRGAGNLRMELLLTYCSKQDSSVSLNALMETVADFEALRKQYEWGTNLPYMISGCNSLPQKDIMEWITKRRYSTASIIQRLQAHIQPSLGQAIHYPAMPETDAPAGMTILIGGGESIVMHQQSILALIEQQQCPVRLIFSSTKHLSLFNTVPNQTQRYIYLVGIEGKRLEKQSDAIRSTDRLIVTLSDHSNETYIPSSLKSSVYSLPQEETDASAEDFKESPLYVSFRIAEQIHTSQIYLLGYDGYDFTQGDKNSLMEETQAVIDFYRQKCSFHSLLPTKYRHLQEKSLYSLLEL